MTVREREYAKHVLELHFALMSGVSEDLLERMRDKMDAGDPWLRMSQAERDRLAAFSVFLYKNWDVSHVQ